MFRLSQLKDLMLGKPVVKRSPRWNELQAAHLKKEPVCQVCGGKSKLNVHHKKPFHLFRELELEPTNLVTLCNARRCHITFGHGGDFKAYNPHVDGDVVQAREMIRNRKYA